jgi:hypothetical protein
LKIGINRQKEAEKKLLDALDAGLVCRGRWSDGVRACALATISSEVLAAQQWEACPRGLLHPVIASRIPMWCDGGTQRSWQSRMRRLARLIGGSTELFRDRNRMARLRRKMSRIERVSEARVPRLDESDYDRIYCDQLDAWEEAIRK